MKSQHKVKVSSKQLQKNCSIELKDMINYSYKEGD